MKRVNTVASLVVLCLTMLSATAIFAQHDHSSHGSMGHTQMDAPPHGGVMKNAGKYRIEMVVDLLLIQDRLNFYLYKGNMKALAGKDVTNASIAFINDGAATSKTALESRGGNHFVAQLKDTEPFRATVEFDVKGKTISTVFEHKGLGHGNASVYTCSMHPDIQSDAPGQCPKCGMFLEKVE
tara:strand:+ start:98 stop:643 length:546 start_codon:yes stop_codon:yes gene_type:complete